MKIIELLHSVYPQSGGLDSMEEERLPRKVCRVQGHQLEEIPETVTVLFFYLARDC